MPPRRTSSCDTFIISRLESYSKSTSLFFSAGVVRSETYFSGALLHFSGGSVRQLFSRWSVFIKMPAAPRESFRRITSSPSFFNYCEAPRPIRPLFDYYGTPVKGLQCRPQVYSLLYRSPLLLCSLHKGAISLVEDS